MRSLLRRIQGFNAWWDELDLSEICAGLNIS